LRYPALVAQGIEHRFPKPCVAGPNPAEGTEYESEVRKYRERKGLTQEALARQLGVSRQTIVNIERGDNEPRVLLAMALAAALGVALVDLFRKGASFR
jgi:putative transcriptional regulator